MIARLTFEWGDDPCVAELSDDLTWSVSPRDELAYFLDQLFNPRDNLSPSRGSPGYAEIEGASKWLEATVEYAQPPREDERDRIY